MSIQNPPSNTSNIFNPSSYPNNEQIDGNDNLTYDSAKEYFLSYPYSQGFETFISGASIQNGLNLDNLNLSNSITFSDASVQNSAGISQSVANTLYASLSNDNTLTGTNIFSDQITTSNGIKFGDNSIQTTSGISQSVANTLYASLSNDNTLTGTNIFSDQITTSNGIKFGDNSIQTTTGISQSLANTLYASLTNNNTLSGINTFQNNINFGQFGQLSTNVDNQEEFNFLNVLPYTGSTDKGFAFWQLYNTNPNYIPILKYNFDNNGQIQLFNTSYQILFSVDAVNGLQMFNNGSQIFLIDSTGNMYFNFNKSIRCTGSFYICPQQNLYLNGDKNNNANGDVRINTNSPLCNTYIDYGGLIFSQSSSYIKFPNSTQQTTAYIPQNITAGSYTNTNLTVNSQGQITAISNGSTIQVNTYNSNQTIIPPTNTYMMNIIIFGSGGLAGEAIGFGSYYVYGGSGAGGNMIQSTNFSWNSSNNLTLTCGSGISTTVVFSSLGSAIVGSGGNGGDGQSSGTASAGQANNTVSSYPNICTWTSFYGQNGESGSTSSTYPYPNPPNDINGGGINNTIINTGGQLGCGQAYAASTDTYADYPASPYSIGGCTITWYIQ
jgi:hypothetical protein